MALETKAILAVADYAVFCSAMCITAGIGIYFNFSGGKQKTQKEYLMADKSMGVLPVACSIMASFISSITLLGGSAESYLYGTQFAMFNVACLIGTPIAAFCYLPVFFKLQNTSAYGYLEKRFGVAARIAASTAFCIHMIIYMGVVLYAPALALSAVTSLSMDMAIITVGLVCTFYSALGGMKAVLISDVLQSLLMFTCIYIVIIKGTFDAGGFMNVWEVANEANRIEFLDFNPDPTTRHSFWSLVVGGIFTFLSLWGVNQAQVQRLLTVGTLNRSRMALVVQWFILTFINLSVLYSGLVAYFHYRGCDPYTSGRIQSPDQLLPRYVMDTMTQYKGLPGLFIAGIFSGAFSSMAAAVNGLATITLEDFLKPFVLHKYNLSELHVTLLTKGLVVFFGVSCLGMAYLASQLGGVLQAAFTVHNSIGGPLLGLFTIGMMYRRGNVVGATVGVVTGLVMSFWVGFGGTKTTPKKLHLSTSECNFTDTASWNITTTETSWMPPDTFFNSTEEALPDDDTFILYKISYFWAAGLGFVTTMLVGIVVSEIYNWRRGTVDDVHPDYLTPPLRWYYSRQEKRDKQKKTRIDDQRNNEDTEMKEISNVT